MEEKSSVSEVSKDWLRKVCNPLVRKPGLEQHYEKMLDHLNSGVMRAEEVGVRSADEIDRLLKKQTSSGETQAHLRKKLEIVSTFEEYGFEFEFSKGRNYAPAFECEFQGFIVDVATKDRNLVFECGHVSPGKVLSLTGFGPKVGVYPYGEDVSKVFLFEKRGGGIK